MQTAQASYSDNTSTALLPRLAFCIGLVSITTALAVRTMFGIDLGDEAYYVTFVAEWLKTGIATSSFLTIHQTAALLPYLACRIFVALSGSTDGLVLFLRLLYVALSAGTALLWFHFLRRVTNPVLAGLSSFLVVSFVPFGLPSPSYNTLGMQALTVALACLGCALTAPSRPALLRWQVASALAWTVGVVAYPTLAAVAAALIVTLIVGGNNVFLQSRYYAALIAAFTIAGLTVAVTLLSTDKVFGSIRYLNMINDVNGFGEKFQKTADLLAANPVMASLFAVSAALGLLRPHIKPILFALSAAIVILTTLAFPATLFVRSHDIILILALLGVGLLGHLNANGPSNERIIAICYTISVCAGAVTTASATNGLYNFCIGGLPAAALALAYSDNGLKRGRLREVAFSGIAALAAIATVLNTSLFYLYGEPNSAALKPRERVESGIFKRLIARRADYALLQQVRDEVAPLIGQSTLAIFSVLRPGIALETHASMAMLTIFPLQGQVSKAGLAFTHDYYSNLKNRPEFVILFEDGGKPINPMGNDFNAWYRKLETIQTSFGPLIVFSRQ